MVIIRIWEGLGNQMFQYAYARALKEKGIDVRLDMDKSFDDMFAKYKNHAQRNNSIQNFRLSIPSIEMSQYEKYNYIKQDTAVRKAVFWLGSHSLWRYRFYEEKVQAYSAKSARIRGNCYVKGWFQSEQYFKNIRAILLKEFMPRKKICISKRIKEALESPQSVSVHIRRGDYVRIRQELGRAYFRQAIEYMKQVYTDPVFLIFSDDLAWVKRNMEINGRYCYVNDEGRLKDYEELFIMSRCRSNIISNSTFSWWAAWLNPNKEKTVIAPRKWMETQGQIIPDEWTVL